MTVRARLFPLLLAGLWFAQASAVASGYYGPAAKNPAATARRPVPVWMPRYRRPRVFTGIDVLAEGNFSVLRGKRIGLLTHAAAVNRDGVPTVDVLLHAPGVKLVSLFATEHGIWNTMPAGRPFPDHIDPRTGLPVHSLYNGRSHEPTAAQLRGIDALVIDLQDIGVRSYTFSGTMKLAMQGCFKHHVEVIILDRPDPLGGLKVDGPLPDPGLVGSSLMCEFPVPYVHGLTMGELAELAKGTPGVLQVTPRQLKRGRLTVVRMVGWRRSMRWPETGLRWIPTSPEIGDFGAVVGYAMTGLGCGPPIDNFRHGVDGQYWFRAVSNRYVKPAVVARDLRDLRLPGIHFREISVTNPRTGRPGMGLYVEVTDWDEWRPTELSFYLMQLACKLEPRNPFAWATRDERTIFLHEVGSAALLHDLATRGARTDIAGYLRRWWSQDRAFAEWSRRFWLYPD
ncbi:MAG: DUF1343 domain-containing protein [Opitutaceae bacterium]